MHLNLPILHFLISGPGKQKIEKKMAKNDQFLHFCDKSSFLCKISRKSAFFENFFFAYLALKLTPKKRVSWYFPDENFCTGSCVKITFSKKVKFRLPHVACSNRVFLEMPAMYTQTYTFVPHHRT